MSTTVPKQQDIQTMLQVCASRMRSQTVSASGSTSRAQSQAISSSIKHVTDGLYAIVTPCIQTS